MPGENHGEVSVLHINKECVVIKEKENLKRKEKEMEIKTMNDEQRKAIALEYFRRLDHGGNLLDLFDDHAQMYFPKWGVARGKEEIGQLFGDLMTILAGVAHETSCLNVIQNGDLVCVEGLSSGKLKNGATWQAGATHAGRWCDVFEIRDFRIQRCHVYLDPDYAGSDTDRYPWLETNPVRRY